MEAIRQGIAAAMPSSLSGAVLTALDYEL